jgi:hypothetical protein
MKREEGIPEDVLNELDIKKIEKPKEFFEVTPIVEIHQIKLPIPSILRRELKIEKGKKIRVKYDSKKKELIYKL